MVSMVDACAFFHRSIFPPFPSSLPSFLPSFLRSYILSFTVAGTIGVISARALASHPKDRTLSLFSYVDVSPARFSPLPHL